jgi:hypothetical protein
MLDTTATMLDSLRCTDSNDSTCTPTDDNRINDPVKNYQARSSLQKHVSLLETLNSEDDDDDVEEDDEDNRVLREEVQFHQPHPQRQQRVPVVARQQQKPTRLFAAIKRKDWVQVLLFLRTGRWRTFHSYFQNDFAHLRDPHRHDQCRVWATDETDGVRRLPLHAAIVAGAPALVLDGLLDLYDDAIKCVDSSNLLPLELALLVDTTSDAAFLTLLEAWPPALLKAMSNKSALLQQMQPPLLGGKSESHVRYQYLGIVVEQSEIGAQNQARDEWKTIVTEAGVEVGPDDHLDAVLSALLGDQKCLREQTEELTRPNNSVHHKRAWWSMSRRRKNHQEKEGL